MDSDTIKRKRNVDSENSETTSTTTEPALKKEKTEETSEQDDHEQDDSSEESEDGEPFVDPRELKPFTGNSLSYTVSSLDWDHAHRRNTQAIYCYCGKPRTRFGAMLQCMSCRQLFHTECLKARPKNLPLPGDWAYEFRCAICIKSDQEEYRATGKNWTDIVRVAIYNLLLQDRMKGGNKHYFQYKDEICSYIDRHWDQLCEGKTRTKTWENTIGSALSTKANFFKSGADSVGSSGYWGLQIEADPTDVRDAPAGSFSKKDGSKKKSSKSSSSSSSFATSSSSSSSKKKRDFEDKLKRKKPLPAVIYYPAYYYDPRIYGYSEVCLAKENSAPQVKLSSDKLTCQNEKGHRMTRSSFGVKEGTWYYEIEILEHKGNTRLGWSTEKGDLQAPVGYDKYSYSYRDKEGTKFHQSRGASYGESYSSGDVIGFYINLPQGANSNTIATLEEIRLTSSSKKEEEPNKLDGSEIIFYKNGVSQGVAFSNIYEGRYFAAGSLYGGGNVRFNFGPKFKYPPKDKEFRPFCEVVEVVMAEPSDIKQQYNYNDITVNENGQLQIDASILGLENKENADLVNVPPAPMETEIVV